MKLRDIRSLVNIEGPARSVSERLARTCHSVDDVRKLAAKRLPRSVFDYIEGGAEDEVSLRRNRSSFADWSFVPRWGAIENLDLGSTVLGEADGPPRHPVADRGNAAFPLGRRSRRCPCGPGSRHSLWIGASQHDADGVDRREHT